MSTVATMDRRENGDFHATSASTRALFVLPHERRDGFWASIRGHALHLAEPSSHALAPTADDLFIVSLASTVAWCARRFLRARGLLDDVSVCAEWRTQDDAPNLTGINLTVMVSTCAEAVNAALAAALEKSLETRSVAEPVVHISFKEQVGEPSSATSSFETPLT
jgi:hypothetical protein